MNVRDKQINLRLTSEEHARLTRSAARRGIGRAAYLRMLLLEQWRQEDRGASSK